MFLNYSVFNQRSLTNMPPARQSYTKLTLYGESKNDTLWVKNTELTSEEILAQEDEPVWDTSTLMLAKYEDNLEAGYYTSTLGIVITGYVIRRQTTGDKFLVDNNYNFITDDDDKYIIVDDPDAVAGTNTTIKTITDVDITTYTDYTPLNNTVYKYTVYPIGTTVNGDIEGAGIEGVSYVSFWGWIIQDAEENPSVVYYFDIEMKTDNIKINKDVKIFENFTPYPAFRYGSMKYRSSSFETIPIEEFNDDGTVLITEDYIDDLIDFLNNGEIKYLRSPSGKMFKVITTNAEYKYFDEISTETYTQPIKIKFDWTEVGAV